MFDFIRGTLVHKGIPHIVVEKEGIGYRIEIPLSVWERLVPQEEVQIFVHTIMRNDTLNLLGFATREERQFFYSLTSVSNVGPKLALNILSTFNISEAAALIRRQDTAQLKKVPGMGQKTARLLIASLGDKDLLPRAVDEEQAPMTEAVEALVFLGYKKPEATAVVRRVQDPNLTTEQLVRHALKELS